MKYFISIFLLVILLPKTQAQSSCVGTPGQLQWTYWTNNWTSMPDTNDLFALENFPVRPTLTQTLGALKTPVNFSENFASFTRGFISVPTTESYTFNVTGDDRVIFYLSTTSLPANKQRVAYTTTWTNETEHTKQTTQTSASITLVGGQNYYFELYHFEGGSGDHATVYWRKTSEPTATWIPVSYEYIKEYACGQSCAPRGTPCNDGNALTTNDQQDGFCNCMGTPQTTNACIGQKGVLEAYYYDNVTGSYVEPDLVNAPKFPLQPDRKEKLQGLYGPLTPGVRDNYGSYVQGYLTVPMSGNYEFNLTGDNQTFFFMSRNDSLEYKQTSQALVMWGVDDTEFNTSSFQKIGPLYMEKGKYYYFEIRHKDNTWRDHFNLYWKTPFHEQKTWKRISDFYLFDYDCELACVPQGTPCDDGNPNTNNDQFDNNCNCIGTPCTAPNCVDVLGNFSPQPPPATTQNITPMADNSWLSCSATNTNPNPTRAANTHWIRYDFGDLYKFDGSRIWNYNVTGETNKGFKNVVVDYSENGTTWTQLGGTYQWNEASGTADYAGFIGPNFNGQKARYILISAVDNWGGGCSGFSKISIEATLCNPSGTSCDDRDPLTFHDRFDSGCRCQGVLINCANDTIRLGENVSLSESAYRAKQVIDAKSIVPTTKNISFTAGNTIVMLPGFDVGVNAVFDAQIENCIAANFAQNKQKTPGTNIQQSDPTVTTWGSVNDDDNPKLKKIVFRLNKPGHVKLSLRNSNNQLLVQLIDNYYQNLGTNIKNIPTNKLAKGQYWVQLEVGNEILRESLVVD